MTTKSKSREFNRQFDQEYNGTPCAVSDEPSNTVPDMNLSVKQLLYNHSRGLNLPINEREPGYFDEEIPRYDDITDHIAHKEELMFRKQEIQKEIDRLSELKNNPPTPTPPSTQETTE